ncbi:hypothetical protein GOP47_0018119 [Adiantum capillus-veneris]|uniref:RING-type E3 ubiquitin transferase n=1 Tax=Adiantum capillus-veneris TaxID=13818 RepID=A0A9D4UHV0_ADICA|nr:hypothetical protein GOP47_0018119 [Adiantum capillus-veneris]
MEERHLCQLRAVIKAIKLAKGRLYTRWQVGFRFAVASGKAQGSMSYTPRTMCPGFHQLPGEGNNSTFIDRNFPSAADTGSSSSFGLQSYNASLLRSSVSGRETLNYPGSYYLDNLRSVNRSACKRKMEDAIISSTFRPILEQRGRDVSWLTEEASTSRGELAIPPLSSDLASTGRIPLLDDLSYSRHNTLLSQLSRARPLQHLHAGRNRHDGGQSNRSQDTYQTPSLGRDATMCHGWMSGEALANEYTMPPARSPHDVDPIHGGNLSSDVVPWCGTAGESSMYHSSVHRKFTSDISRVAQARNFWNAVPDTMQNTFDRSRRGSPGFPYKDSTSQRSYRALDYAGHILSLHPPALPLISHNGFNGQGAPLPSRHAATGSMILGSQAAPGCVYSLFGSLNRSELMLPFRGSTENVGASPLRYYYGMPFWELEALPARRGSGQRLPNHESLDLAVAYDGFNIRDHHIGLQPDVDNMSYEELLALEERIGNVNTGLSEENICNCLKRSKHSSCPMTISVSQDSEIKCSICQEEYMEGEELGQLKCSHSYHTDCIKQWLVLKNQCPICKAAALSLT